MAVNPNNYPTPDTHTGVWYIVACSYSHTDKRQLIKILSRRMMNKLTAEDWKDCEESIYKDKHPKSTRRFFVIQVENKDWNL